MKPKYFSREWFYRSAVKSTKNRSELAELRKKLKRERKK